MRLAKNRETMKTAIFDLDGTLADTSGDLIEAANSCFRSLGCSAPLDPGADQAAAFQGGRAMLRLGVSRVTGEKADENFVDLQYPLLLAAYGRKIDRFTTLYPGVESALGQLKSSGWRLGVCTNKPEGLSRILLERLKLAETFHSIVGADTLPVRKPDPAPYTQAVEIAEGTVELSFFVGDTLTDRDTARAAGVPIVLSAFGSTISEVQRLEPDAVLEHFDALPSLAEILVA